MAREALASSSPSVARRRHRTERRERILDAAIAVFARDGYHGARISDIAREAGIAYGLVYHYFTNKEDILDSIFEERWGGFLAEIEGIADAPQPAGQKLLSVATRILDGYRRRPDWVKVLVLDVQRSSRFAEPSRLRAVGRLFRVVERVVRDGQREGAFRADLAPEVACHVFLGALELVITGLVLEWTEMPAGADAREARARELASTVVELVLHGLASGGGER